MTNVKKKNRAKNQDKNLGGRPSKYEGEKTLKKAKEYIEKCVDSISQKLESTNKKTGRRRFINLLKVNIPKAEGLALYLGVSRQLLYDWADKHKEFHDILERINQIQVNRVIDEALAGNYNSTIAKLLLAKHGYRDEGALEIEFPQTLIDLIKNGITPKTRRD